MTAPIAPIALTCGEPAGVGPELAVAARRALGAEVPFFWIGDPRLLPAGTGFAEISRPQEAAGVPAHLLPVLRHDFPAPNVPGVAEPANAASVIAVIERAVTLVQGGEAGAICTSPIHKKAL